MSVIVHDEMPVDLALRLLWREATREDIINQIRTKRYHVKPSQIKHDKVKGFIKGKRRRRSVAKRQMTKGY